MTGSKAERDDGYRGIWFTLGQFDSQYGDKYSGGLGTYTAKHVPLAVYAAEARKTFFVYGGCTADDNRHLLAMVSYYDHDRGAVPRPVIIHDKVDVDDPHDNPSIAIDGQGHIWVFVSGRAKLRPGFTYRSTAPFSIDEFHRVNNGEFTYPQPWWINGCGFLHLFIKYTGVRELYWSSSPDGMAWSPHRKLAGMGGHYQISRCLERRVATAFNMHPIGNVDVRTNLYYAETDDMGKTWRTADGSTVETPMTDIHCPALVRDYMVERRLVYMKDITFDEEGHPVILVITSGNHRAGPGGDPRIWTIVHWTGEAWRFSEVTRSTHNYDMGSLYIDGGEPWRIIGPTEPGPQLHGTGGEIAIWVSGDHGLTWRKEKDITGDGERNHSYVRRPVNAHPDFYGFWADGNPDRSSQSHLYFTNKAGSAVWRLPRKMSRDFATPTVVSSR